MDPHGVIAALFGAPRALVGMIHVPALPGTPGSRLAMAEILEATVAEARQYRGAGFHGLMIENMHDRPYLKGTIGPEIVAALAVVGHEVRRAAGLPLGVQVLAAGNRQALAVALAAGAAFVRVEGFVFANVADEGLLESDAGALLRYRRAIGATGVRVFADVKKKHAAHAVTADVDIQETARAAEFFQADGVVVTGAATGRAADPGKVLAVSRVVKIPTLVGSGITALNLAAYSGADAFIVGSSIKQEGLWSNPLDPSRLEALARAFSRL